MTSYRLTLPYPPLANRMYRTRRTRNGAALTYKSSEYQVFCAEVAALATIAGVEPTDNPVELVIHSYRPQRSGDVDGVIKPVLDSLQGLAYTNDKQVIALHVRRFDDKYNPRVEVTIHIMEADRG